MQKECKTCGFTLPVFFECVCGDAYCSDTCGNPYIQCHKSICDPDFHIRTRNLILFANHTDCNMSNISNHTVKVYISGKNFDVKQFPGFTWEASGCITCGKRVPYYSIIFQAKMPGKFNRYISMVKCKECLNENVNICSTTYLPTNKCEGRVYKEQIAKMLEVLVQLKEKLPIDIIIYLMGFVFLVNPDIVRLKNISVDNHTYKNHKCQSYFTIQVNK